MWAKPLYVQNNTDITVLTTLEVSFKNKKQVEWETLNVHAENVRCYESVLSYCCSCVFPDDSASQPAHQCPPLSEEFSHSFNPGSSQRLQSRAQRISERGEIHLLRIVADGDIIHVLLQWTI